MSERITGEEPTMAVVPGNDSGAALPQEAPSKGDLGASMPPRHVVGGRYEILGLVGSGGMGTVYRARDSELDDFVALKLLRRDLVDQPGMLERFRQEVKLARRVTHRNVARTFDIGESDGDKFLTMEFIDGEALSARIAREGALPLDFTVEVAQGICAGLGAAHEAGVIHRDLKPDNVLVARDGRVVVTDFGIARALVDAGRAATVGLALGTPAYMAPEQVEGGKALDARADIYALGAMLYECLTGERPWKGDSVWSVAAARLVGAPPDPRLVQPDLPRAVAEFVLRCMARDRDRRFPTAADAAGSLAGLTMPGVPLRHPAVAPAVPPIESGTKTVAVLPFRNAGESADEYIAAGLTEDLIDGLSMTHGLRVLAPGAATRAGVADPRQRGMDLRVDVIVDGSVRRAGETLRVSVRVISVADGFQLWAKRFDRPEKDALSVSDEAANAIADALTLRRSVPARVAPQDARAVELYLRARQAVHAGWRQHIKSALELLEQALVLAPDDPTILSTYASAQMRRFMFSRQEEEEAEQKILQSAHRAIAIAPHLGEPRAVLATLGWSTGDFAGCARQVRDALRVSPSSADLNALSGRLLLEIGQPARALPILQAVLALEPARNLVAIDVLRAKVLLGDWSVLDPAIDSTTSDETAQMHFMLLLRLAMWRRDEGTIQALAHSIEARGAAPREVLTLLDVIKTRTVPATLTDLVFDWGRIGRGRRRATFFQQILTEVAVFAGDDRAAELHLRVADELDLLDLTWLDRCPLFDRMHASPVFIEVHEHVAARAKECIEILDGRRP